MIEVIEFKGIAYPKFQSEGFAAKYCFAFAKEFCKGKGLDVGCGKMEWALPGSFPVDPATIPNTSKHHALDLPNCLDEFGNQINWDYIFSSHMLEHVPDWVGVLDYWISMIRPGGIIFLYLPDFSQRYWRPFSNRKHIHAFTPQIIEAYFIDRFKAKCFVSGVDLNNSFIAVGEKQK